MGNGASCADRSTTPPHEKLRTMLILRAYNCRPRDWTMKDQFEAAAENGVLTKDDLRKALRLGECPRIEALLDRCCLFDHPLAQGKLENISSGDLSDNNSAHSATGSISVASLMSFVEDGRKQAPVSTPGERKKERQEQQQERPQHCYRLHNHLPQQLHQFPFSITSADKTSRKNKRHQAPLLSTPPLPLTTTSTPESLIKSSIEPSNNDARSHGTADLSTPPSSPTAALECCQATTIHAASPRGGSSHGTTASVNDNQRESEMNHATIASEGPPNSTGGTILSPRVVPLTSKWALSALSASTTSANAKKPREATHTGTSTMSARMLPGGRREKIFDQNDRHSFRTARASSSGERGADELREGDELEDRRETLPVNHGESRERGGGHCTTLVKHLGAVLGLRGKEAYRRLGPGLPVWRKRETLIQERIVQYTTLDEDGKVQELLETEKSQTEVLHMECKRTGEFAHSECTHFESGETFNGEVVLEEAGVERYVHLRSVDDEYEHLESTLPSRARSGGAAGGVGGSPPAEEVESGPGADETRRRPDANAQEVRGDGTGDGDGGRDGDGGSRNGVKPTAVKRSGCDMDGGPNKNDVPQGDPFRHNQRPEHHDPDGSEDHMESSPAAFVPLEENAEAVDHQAGASRGASRCKGRPRSTRAGQNAADVDAAAENYPLPSSPLPYHYRSPSCSPRLSPRPARSPYRQEGVGERISSGRGEVKQEQRREGSASKDYGLSSRGDAGGPGGSGFSPLEVADEEDHVGESSHAFTGAWEDTLRGDSDLKVFGQEQEGGGITPDAQVPLSSSFITCRASPSDELLARADSSGPRDTGDLTGGVGEIDDCVPSETWRENHRSKRHPENGSPCASTRRSSGADVPEEQMFWANNDGHVDTGGGGSIDRGGYGNGCGGSVIFVDDQVGQGEDVRVGSNFDGEEGWWQPESGSVLGGLDVLSQKDISSAVYATSEKEMGIREQRDVAPDNDQRSLDEVSLRPCSEGRLPNSAGSAKDDDGVEERVRVSRLIEGLRTSSAPVPVASAIENEEEECHYGEALLGRTTASDPGQGGSHGSSAGGPDLISQQRLEQDRTGATAALTAAAMSETTPLKHCGEEELSRSKDGCEGWDL